MRKAIFYTFSILLVLAFSSCNDEDSLALEKVTIHETFESGDNGWQAVFGSYPEGEEEFYELKSGIKQLVDLALLSNGMLKGEALDNFVKRSVELIK